MAKAVLQARGKYVTAILIWRTVLATSLCLCALTALYYEVRNDDSSAKQHPKVLRNAII